MSAPTTRILDFRSRVDTLGDCSAGDREAWQRRYRKARRSFYKYVGKQGYYTPLERREYQWGDRLKVEYVRHPGNGYTNGLPSFDASRSAPRDWWESKFTRHRDQIEKAHLAQVAAEGEAQCEGWDRRFAVSSTKHSKFLQMVKTAASIQKYVSNI